MTSNAPPSDSETSPYTLNSSPLAHNNPHNVGVVSQSQRCSPSQSWNIFSPNGQIDLLLQHRKHVSIPHQFFNVSTVLTRIFQYGFCCIVSAGSWGPPLNLKYVLPPLKIAAFIIETTQLSNDMSVIDLSLPITKYHYSSKPSNYQFA